MSQQWKSENVGGEGGGEEDVQMPLGVGGGENTSSEESYAEPKRKMNTSTLALFAAFGAALVVLYLLGLGNKPKVATADEMDQKSRQDSIMKEWVAKNTSGLAVSEIMDNIPRLLLILEKTLGTPQLVSTDLPGGETVFGEAERPVGAPPPPPPPPPVNSRQRDEAIEFKSLKLQMVMMGTPSRAMISNKIVSVGTKFTFLSVKDIRSDGVLLTDEDKNTFELKLNAPNLEQP